MYVGYPKFWDQSQKVNLDFNATKNVWKKWKEISLTQKLSSHDCSQDSEPLKHIAGTM